MNLKECILDNIKCENIIVFKKDGNNPIYVKKNNKLFLELRSINCLVQKVYKATRIGNEKIEIFIK